MAIKYNLYRGTMGDDYLEGAHDKNNAYNSLGGDDIVVGGNQFDKVKLGSGSDFFYAGNGPNVVLGGSGADYFAPLEGSSGHTTILDWQAGTDRFNVSGLDLTDMSEIRVGHRGGDTFVKIEEATFRILGNVSIDEDDFIFAEPAPTGTLLDFDDIDLPSEDTARMEDGYAGIDWGGFFVKETDEFDENYETGYVPNSGDNIIKGSGRAYIEAEDNFDFESFYVSAAWRDGMEITISGYDDSALIGNQVITFDYAENQYVKLNDAIFDSVDRVEFNITDGGTHHGGASGSGSGYAIDDMFIFF
ncbi:calcium-binding protein [Celeribacter litoreus]|uniref:hypothetical protein n=1 Tax=Celeribacter litoreus TaxID=2876714 RepID=UPI001CCA7DEB|nr:hypothetical protein [Celeribacter litoreus]MCA0042439.1 hypothetical protein [Celeribacter litoreus]